MFMLIIETCSTNKTNIYISTYLVIQLYRK